MCSLSNEPAEELARTLIDSGKGAFELCGFIAGGMFCPPVHRIIRGCSLLRTGLGSEAMEGAVKLARQVSIGFGIFVVSWQLSILLSTGMNRTSPNARILFLGAFLFTVTLSLHSLYPGTPHAAHHTKTFSNMRTSTRCHQRYAKRFQCLEETEEQYVKRLRQELENKFLELGPDTVIGCK
jgi:E3 ubiquitin-protein ligase TRIP12